MALVHIDIMFFDVCFCPFLFNIYYVDLSVHSFFTLLSGISELDGMVNDTSMS